MLWFVTHGLTWFVGTLVLFLCAAIAGWVFVDFGVALIVMVVAAIFVALALPLLLMYYDESNPAQGRYPDALR